MGLVNGKITLVLKVIFTYNLQALASGITKAIYHISSQPAVMYMCYGKQIMYNKLNVIHALASIL